MNDDLTVTQIVADESQTCFQCFNLGLPLLGIAKGDTCMLIEGPDKTSFACMDCFNRLNAEIEKMKDEESDEEEENDCDT